MCYLVALHCLSNFCNNIFLCLCIFLQTKYKKIRDRNSSPFMNTWGPCLLLLFFAFCVVCVSFFVFVLTLHEHLESVTAVVCFFLLSVLCLLCVCVFFLSSSCILCTQCCQFLWIVSSYLWFVLIHSFQIFTINIKWNY